MAATSLGRLTLDLAVKLSEFTDGMTRAERETKARTEAMTKSVNSFKDNLMDALGGTEVGSAIDGLNSKLGLLSGGASMATAALSGMAVGGAVTAAVTLTRIAVETAKADAEMAKLAQTAGSGVRSFQILTHASEQYGISQEQLSSILADVQEKLGEFTTTGGGGAADFFEQLKLRTGESDDAMQAFAQTLQGKDGIDAIRAIKEQMDDWGITIQEQRFILESLGSDLGNLQPILSMTSSEWDAYGRSLEEAGIVKTQEAIDKSIELERQTRFLTDTYQGIQSKLAGAVIPVMADFITELSGAKDYTDDLNNSLSQIDPVVDSVRKAFVGAAYQTRLWALDIKELFFQVSNLGDFIYALGSTTTFGDMWETFKEYDKKSYESDRKYLQERNKLLSQAELSIAGYNPDKFATGSLGIKFGLGQVLPNGQTFGPVQSSANAIGPYRAGYTPSLNHQVKTGKQLADEADREAKAKERTLKATKAITERYRPNPVNSRVLEQASTYNYASIEDRYGLPTGILAALSMQESRGNPNARSPVGAKGAFQFMPATARRFGISGQESDVAKSAEAAAKYLNYLMKKFGSVELALAGYNAGEGNVQKYGNKIPPFKETQKYVPSVMSHLAFMQGKEITKGGSQVSISSMLEKEQRELERAAQEEARRLEQQLRAQNSIAYQYASEREKAELDHKKRLAEIEEAYGVDTPETAKYQAAEVAHFEAEKHDRVLSIMQQYQSEEVRLTRQHEQALQKIRETFAENDPQRQLYLDAQEATYQEEMRRIRKQDAEKFIQKQQYIDGIRKLIQQGQYSTSQSVNDTIAQNTMSTSDYAMYSLGNQEDSARATAKATLNERMAAISEVDDMRARNDLMLEAKAEYEAQLYAIDLEFAKKRKDLDQEVMDNKIALYQSATGSVLGVLQAFFGESKNLQRVAWAADKGMTLARILIKEKEALMNAWSSAPFPYNLGMVATTAVQTGALAAAASAITPKGFKTGGYTGNMGVDQAAGVVHGQEYVFDAMSTKTIGVENLERIRQGKGLGGDINIYNYAPGVDATAARRDDGTVDVKIEQRIKQSWANLQNPNSFESDMINAGYQVQRRRR